MYYEIYLDIFFLENMAFDYIVLLLTAAALKKRGRSLHFLAASAAGAAGACLLFISPLRRVPFLPVVCGFLMLPLLVRIGFGGISGKAFARAMLTFLGMAILSGGIVTVLQEQFSCPVFVLCVPGALILTWILRGFRSWQYRTQDFYEVILGYHGKTVCVRALRDTGNRLRDPLTGKPVSILSFDAVRELLEQNTKMYYIPYHSVGKSSGLLAGMTLDYMKIRQEKDYQRLEKPIIAVSREPVSKAGHYQMILHPLLLET